MSTLRQNRYLLATFLQLIATIYKLKSWEARSIIKNMVRIYQLGILDILSNREKI